MSAESEVTLGQSMTRKDPITPVGWRLRQARLEAGFKTHRELADAVGMTGQTIYRVETGGFPLGKKTAEVLAPVLRKSSAWLMYGVDSADEGDETPQDPPQAVEQYLTSDFGADVSPRVQKLLESCNYSSIGLPKPSVKDVHRVREMIEINLSIAAKQRNA